MPDAHDTKHAIAQALAGFGAKPLVAAATALLESLGYKRCWAMKRTKSEPRMGCVTLKRQAQAKIYAETRGMSATEQIEYFRRRAESGVLGKWWKQVTRQAAIPLAVREISGKYGK